MKIIFALFILSASVPSFSKPVDDGQVTNGGDGYVAEFFLILDSALAQMPLTMPLENDETLKRSTLEFARNTIKVTSEESLRLEDREVSAINQPYTTPPTIKISRTFWKVLSENQKLQLAIHELLPIVGVYDADYKNSTVLIQIIKQSIPLSYPALTTAVSTCDANAIESIPMDSFLRFTTPIQRNSLLIEALNRNCGPLLTKYISMNIDMDICIGSLSVISFYLKNALDKDQSANILKLLMQGGASAVKTCSYRVNNACTELHNFKFSQRDRFAEILQCK